MNEMVETRELIMLDGHGVIIRGTYHKAHDDNPDTQLNLLRRDRVGVVFLNGLTATRAGHGDAVVYWADSLAERGYPSFRLDLPGHGDSEGDPPTEWLGLINMGGYASIASATIRELAARFNLSGVVIVGQCSGAVSAIYTAAAIRECVGLVLLDPYFHLTQSISPQVRGQLHLWALQSRLGGALRKIYGLLKEICLFFRGNVPPENANVPLLRCWKEVASSGRPILILKAPSVKADGMKLRVGEFDYLKYVLGLAGRTSQVVVKVLDGADHAFASRPGRTAVRQNTEQWLNTFFPLIEYEQGVVSTLGSERDGNRRHNKLHENYLH
jgi:pimeloyl-ACP methyl ester carboxylesterase